MPKKKKPSPEPEPITFSDDVAEQQITEEQKQAMPNPFVSQPPVMPTAQTNAATAPVQATVTSQAPVQPPVQATAISQDANVVSLEDDVTFDSLDKFPLLAKDEVARISLVAFGPTNVPLCRMTQYFFDQAANFGFIAPKTPDVLKKVVGKLGQPKVKFGTIIVKYHSDKAGNLLSAPGQAPGFTFYAWMFSTDKWNPLKQLHKEWNLFGRDVILACAEPKFQKFQLAPAQDCLWKHSPDADKVLEMGTMLFNTQLEKFFNREMPDQEIMIRLGFIAAPAAVAAASPFGNQRQITGQVGAGSSPFSTLIK